MTYCTRFLSFLLCALFLLSVTPGHAQFADQAQWAGTAGGTATAITLAVPNWDTNKAGVPVRFLPSADSTGATTINVNGVGAIALNKPANTGLAAIAAGDLRSGQYAEVVYDGTRFVLTNQLGQSVIASSLSSSALGFTPPVNLQLSAAVATNNLTISLLTAAGAAPTATTPVNIVFRDATIANGDPVLVSVTGALTFTINSTNTMGCVSAQMCRLWVMAINNAGTVALCAFNALNGTNVIAPNEAAVQTSASGTTGGSSAQTLYCGTSAVSSKAIRYLGYVEIQEATAGTWATGPTYTQLFGPGIPKPGSTVQVVTNSTTTAGTTSSTTFAALSSGMTTSIVPTSAANVIRIHTTGTVGISGGIASYGLQVARSTTLIGNPLALLNEVAGDPAAVPAAILVYDVPNTTSSVTYGFYGKASASGMSYPVSSSGAIIELEEIQG